MNIKIEIILALLLVISLLSLYHISTKSAAAISLVNRLTGKEQPTTNTTPKKVCSIQELMKYKGNQTDPRKLCADLDNYKDRVGCYQYIGVMYSPTCESLPNQPSRIFCYNNISRAEKKPEWCDTLYGTYQMECRGGCALNLMRPSLCEIWNETISRYVCYGKSAGETQDDSVCTEKIPPKQMVLFSSDEFMISDTLLDMCHTSVATYAGNASLCDRVSDQELRTYCISLATGDNRTCSQMKTEFHTDKCYRDTDIASNEREYGNPLYPERNGRSYLPIYIVMRDKEDGKDKIW